MIVDKKKALLFLTFLSGILCCILGSTQIGPVNFHFYIVFFNFLIILLFFLHYRKITKFYIVIPVIFILTINFMRPVGQFGYIQNFYTLLPFLFFLIASSIKFSEEFDFYLKRVVKISSYTSLVLFFLWIIFGLTQINTRWSCIFFALVILLNLILNYSRSSLIVTIVAGACLIYAGSRGVSLALLGALILTYLATKYRLIYSIPIFFFLILLFLIKIDLILHYIFKIDMLRDRTFYDGVYSFDKIKSFEFNTSGRDVAWPTYWQEISSRKYNSVELLFGSGSGSVSDFGVNKLGPSWFHPHNEIIRLIFDYGYFGLIVILLFWVSIIFLVFMKSRDIKVKQIVFSISCFVFIIMLTDNPFMYPIYFGNISLFLLGYCYSKSLQSDIKGFCH